MAQTQASATLRDWLDMHQLTPDQVRDLLTDLKAMSQDPTPDPVMGVGGDGWPEVLRDLGVALPQAARVLAHIAAHVRVDLSPDLSRFPRAFTLHDDGRGQPFVSCPQTGRLSDLLVLAHEAGHVCQIIASDHANLPPVQRETAAYLAECLMIEGRRALHPLVAAQLAVQHQARTRRVMATRGAALMTALQNPQSPYDYGWNYPVARILAARAASGYSADQQWQVFVGTMTLPDMVSRG